MSVYSGVGVRPCQSVKEKKTKHSVVEQLQQNTLDAVCCSAARCRKIQTRNRPRDIGCKENQIDDQGVSTG